jgi:hypothetical protein
VTGVRRAVLTAVALVTLAVLVGGVRVWLGLRHSGREVQRYLDEAYSPTVDPEAAGVAQGEHALREFERRYGQAVRGPAPFAIVDGQLVGPDGKPLAPGGWNVDPGPGSRSWSDGPL